MYAKKFTITMKKNLDDILKHYNREIRRKMYAKKHFRTESKFFKWYNYVETVEQLCKPGYHARYIDPKKQELGFIIYDEEFGELTPEAQQLYLELEED